MSNTKIHLYDLPGSGRLVVHTAVAKLSAAFNYNNTVCL